MPTGLSTTFSNKKIRLLGLLLITINGAAAQISLESTLHLGSVWRHTPRLTTQTGGPIFGQELGLRFQTTGRRDWHQWQRYPAFGLSLVHYRLGEGSHGDGLGLLPNLSIPIIRKGRFAAILRLGTGLAWVTNPYDYFDNPGQNAIGSHWNNITQFRLGGEWRLDGHWRLNAGAALTHFSNGAFALPNFGMNIPSGFAGLVWSPKPVREADFLPAKTNKRTVMRRFGGILQTGLAMLEYGIYDGPKYPIWSGSAAGYFHFNQVNRLHLGFDYEFNKAIYEFGLHTAEFESESEARRGATRLAVFVADEFLFGSVGIQLQIGRYVGKGFNQHVLKQVYEKLTVRAYFPKILKTDLRPHVGITLKAHTDTAEHIALNAGLAF